MTAGEERERIRRLHEHLEATAELPVDRRASRWLGEADAIASDVAGSDLPASTTRERVATIRDLLSEVDDLAHEDARSHVAAARRLCDAILAA